jgi:hypothetical protein
VLCDPISLGRACLSVLLTIFVLFRQWGPNVLFQISCKPLLDCGLKVKGSEIDLKLQLGYFHFRGQKGIARGLGSDDLCAGDGISAGVFFCSIAGTWISFASNCSRKGAPSSSLVANRLRSSVGASGGRPAVSLDCGGIKPFSSPAQKPHACILPAAPHSLLRYRKGFPSDLSQQPSPVFGLHHHRIVPSTLACGAVLPVNQTKPASRRQVCQQNEDLP